MKYNTHKRKKFSNNFSVTITPRMIVCQPASYNELKARMEFLLYSLVLFVPFEFGSI